MGGAFLGSVDDRCGEYSHIPITHVVGVVKSLKWREAGMLFLLLAANYGLNTIAFRMVAKGSYIGVAQSDTLIAWWGL